LVGGTWLANRAAPAPRSASATTFVPVLDGISDAIRIHRPQDTSPHSLKGAPGAQPDYGQHPSSSQKASPAAPAEDAAMPKPVEPTPAPSNPMDALAA